MIRHLYIKDFVLINELNLNFENGFSAFTGETGAGKSILIDAISLLCAERASSSFIAKGKEKTIIEGTFDLSKNFHAKEVLNEAGFDVNEEEVTFTREILISGKSTARIDHRIVTLSLLKECLNHEIDIHGQRENAYLLNVANHIQLLDAFMGSPNELNALKDAYLKYAELKKEKEKALQETYNENDLEYFQYEIEEIENAKLKIGEDEELEEKEKQYRLVKDSYEKIHAIFDLYDGSVSESFYELNRAIQNLGNDENLIAIQEEVNSSYYGLQDAIDNLHSTFDDSSFSEDEINEMEERLFEIQKLKRKYGRTIQDILEKKEQLQNQVNAFSNRTEYLKQMDEKIAKAFSTYSKLAETISKERKNYAKKLDIAIAKELKELKLDHAKFQTRIKDEDPSIYGNDHVEFLISMNKGEDLKPLAKTASGGELSRLMLGLKVLFTKLQKIELVIFDEIDTGVSGPVASSIGKKMKELSNDCQVFSVTHLAQVAAHADHHYLVSKQSDSQSTHSSVRELDEDSRIEELAKISNGEVTDMSLNAAKELLARSKS